MKLNIILLAIVIILIIYYWRLQVNKRGADGFSLKSCYNRQCESCPEGEEITSVSECQKTAYGNYGNYGYRYGYGGRYWGGTANWGNSYPKNCWQSGNHRYFNTGGTKDYSHSNVQKVCNGKVEKKDGDPFIMDDASKPCPKGQ